MAAEVDDVLKAAEYLELSLGEEFDIPIVENVPTLESILNEEEDDSLLDDDCLAPLELLQGEQIDSGSLSSQEGILGDKLSPRIRRKKSLTYQRHGSVMRHVVLKSISTQILSAMNKVDAGMPTALAVFSLIAVGTSHGLVLVFDPRQLLKWCLGSTAVGAQFGAVSALSFNKDCSRLLCGFAKGQITMWDLTNGKLIRTITDVHPPGTAILHVKFTDDLTLALCSDSGGSVFELEFKRLIGVRTCESKCLFSGSRGEVCTIEPLLIDQIFPEHSMQECIIVAMASLSKVLIVTVRPDLCVLFQHTLKGDAATLPLLAWQFVVIQASTSDRSFEPVLAFARDQTIHFFQTKCKSPEEITCTELKKAEVTYKLLSMTWMNSKTMLLIDTSEKAHIIDVQSMEELEVLELSHIQLVYSTSFYKSLATGGNVSKALAYGGERACYQSMVTHMNQTVLLGMKRIHVLTIRTWEERIDVLMKKEMTQDALSLALSFHDGTAKAVVGLPGGTQKRKKIVAEKMLELLMQFVDGAMTIHCPTHGKVQALEEYYQNIVPICVDYCLKLDRMDVLFGPIYSRFEADAIARGFFLESLEPYMLSDWLARVSPDVLKHFVEHYEARGLLPNLEACIVHVDITSLDINQVVLLCWRHGLYDALLYVYNHGMRDYTTPLFQLLSRMGDALQTARLLTDEQVKLGNKVLVYISCCLAGRAYPLGDIPDDLAAQVKDEVFGCITCLHTKENPEDEPAYPYLRVLLQFDTREFFNVLALAFEEPEFNTPDGVEKRQRVVDILLQIMVESIGFTPTQIGMLFTFLARQMARHENTIMVNRLLFEQVLESLCSAEGNDEERHEERQQALMELLHADGLTHFNEDRLLALTHHAKFFRICEILYDKRRDYDKIVSCYREDSARQHQAFAYVEQIMTGAQFTAQEKKKVEVEVIAHIEDFLVYDREKTAQMVLLAFTDSLTHIMDILSDKTELLYKFLHSIFDYRLRNGSALYLERQATLEPQIEERYIDLMCQFDAASVYDHILSSESYRLEETLQICRKHNVSNATAFLLEKSGDIQGAFNIMLENLQAKLTATTAIYLSDVNSEDSMSVALSGVEAVLLVLIQLCQRTCGPMDEQERKTLWFPLLDCTMAPQQMANNETESKKLDGLKTLTRHVLNSMMGYIALPAILERIIKEPCYSAGRFGDVRELILGMLDTYSYEKTLLHACNNLVNNDLHQQLVNLTVAASQGIMPLTDCCDLCRKAFATVNSSETICFRCGHGYHTRCLQTTGSCRTIEGDTVWTCYVCSDTRRGGYATQRRPRVLSMSASPAATGSKTNPLRNLHQQKDINLGLEQVIAIENLRRIQKTQSRLAILAELSRPASSSAVNAFGKPSAPSILQNDRFQLHLAAPIPDFDAAS